MRISQIILEKITIRSPQDANLFAQVRETPEGIEVKFYQRSPGAGARLVDRGLVDAPFHLVVDRVHAVLAGQVE